MYCGGVRLNENSFIPVHERFKEKGGGEIATNYTNIYNFQHDTENVRLQANFVL